MLLVTKISDRGTRHAWSARDYFVPLQTREAYLLDEDGLRICDTAAAMSLFVKGTSSELQAKNLPERFRRGMVKKTAEQMLAGQVRYHAHVAAPHGFGICTTHSFGTETPKLLYLDTEACRPRHQPTPHGLSEVRDDHGQVVDQVENVRFVLTHLGRPDWPSRRIAREMVSRQLSSTQHRANYGLKSSVSTESAAAGMIKTIVGNLNLYETGVLTRDLGYGVQVRITGCIPPDGPWASPADFERIRSWRTQQLSRTNRHAVLAFSGVQGTLGTTTVKLSARNARGRLRYRIVDSTPELSAERGAMIDPAAFGQSVIEALSRIDSSILQVLLPHERDDDPSEQVTRWRAEISGLESQRDRYRTERDQALEFLLPSNGTRVTGSLLENLNERYNTAETEVVRLEDEIATLRSRLDDELARRPAVAEASALLHLVSSLRDPSDTTMRQLWKRTLRDLTFTIEHLPNPTVVSWSGAIEVVDPGVSGSILIPFHGRSTIAKSPRRSVPVAVPTFEEWVHLFSNSAAAWPSRPTALQAQMQERWQLPPTHPVFHCTDPRLLRYLIECAEHPEDPTSQVAIRLGTHPALIQRIRELHFTGAGRTPPRAEWVGRGAPLSVAAHVLAAGHESGVVTADEICSFASSTRGSVHMAMSTLVKTSPRWTSRRKKGYRFECECGSHAAAPMRLREVDGAVCLACRTDDAGVVWPAEPYDRFRARPELWPTRADPGITDDEEQTA